VHLGEQTALLVEDSHHPFLDEHLEAHFVELADANDVGGEAWDEVDVPEAAVLPILAGEEDGSAALDPDDGAIAENAPSR
jgi:hypothetical protein